MIQSLSRTAITSLSEREPVLAFFEGTPEQGLSSDFTNYTNRQSYNVQQQKYSNTPNRFTQQMPGGSGGGAAAAAAATSAGLSFAQKAAAAAAGLQLGSEASKDFLQQFGQSPDIVGPEQEQQAINQHQDKEIQSPTAPPFSGGQISGMRYLIKLQRSIVFSSYERTEIGYREDAGPIGGFNHGSEGTNWYLSAGGGRSYEPWIYKKEPPDFDWVGDGLNIAKVEILEITALDPLPPEGDRSLPPGDDGITSHSNNPAMVGGTAPLTTPTPTGTDKKEDNKFGVPGLNLPSVNNKVESKSDTDTDTNKTPLNLPSQNPSTDPSSKNKNKNTFSTPNISLIPPLFWAPEIDPTTKDTTNFKPKSDSETKTPVNTEPSSCPCSTTTNQKLDQQNKKLDDISDKLILYDIGLDTKQLAKLDDVLDRMDPKVTGGLSGFLGTKFTQLWASSAFDRALSLMNLAASIHNALMLSRNIAATLGLAITNILALIGIKDPEGTVFGFEQMIGKTIEAFLKGILGEENYTTMTETWKKANRIYQAAVNIYQLLNDSLYSVAEGLELIGEYSGKVGNALKKSGTILDNCYSWMNETFNFKSKKNRGIEKVIQELQQAQEIASDLTEITEEFREAQENITEIGNQVNVLKKELKDETDAKKTKETTSHDASQTPIIPKSAMIQPPPATPPP